MMRHALPPVRRLVPLILFVVLMIALVSSALMSIGDVFSMQRSLSEETQLLGRLKERVAAGKNSAELDPKDYVFDVASQGVATAELQRRVSELMGSAGADLQLSEIIPPDTEGEVGRLAIAVNFEIDDARLPDLLHAIENAKPALLVDRLSLRTRMAGQSAARERLQGTATIFAAWRAQP